MSNHISSLRCKQLLLRCGCAGVRDCGQAVADEAVSPVRAAVAQLVAVLDLSVLQRKRRTLVNLSIQGKQRFELCRVDIWTLVSQN